ncbi:TIGR03985 family CRISPR-associated protein [Cylindrospermum sp. FACHB-282]|uniref:TIGR03985 family CRISPR-associated protein n=1 Tax=Cylindrospermum sp. FACHB-282 TaxID=2692794 RepID=UPI0016874A9B|nr:TIGR03985 family CRISPR-associated protein [Cylindrospermum sp. FACHB-282]MBD2384739.1 TIGR03985 family CRISPR-associated protein [Cylindrospermum sp. FACHB-282]
MSEQIFLDIPQVELLQWLARGSLKQNLLRAIRLWVWLRSLYGSDETRLVLDDPFTFADWRDAFFNQNHPKAEAIPDLHDANCLCAKTTAAWLFDAKTGLNESEWKRSLLTHVEISQKLDALLQQRLFGVTRRSLQADLEILQKLGWLEYRQQKYHRVKKLPSRPISANQAPTSTNLNSYELNFLNQEDLASIAQNHSQQICGVQRFFFKLDYVSPRTTIDQVEDWQHELREIWGQTPVPPIRLTYNSARLGKAVESLIYPVCIYYVQRAVYLCAFGQSPDRKTDWYNYRLDRIQQITPIKWTNTAIPQILQQRYNKATLPNPEEIEGQLSKAWGFDFYLQSQLMLLRFVRNYHDRYIQHTFRHETFQAISYQQAQRLIRQHTPQLPQQQALLKVLAARSHEDAYYRVNYRHGDNNVMMRLRAWRPKAEVLSPWDLRQKIAADVAAEFQLYHDSQKL